MRLLGVLAAGLALASCQQAKEQPTPAEQVGRYQMMPQMSGNVTVVVLDTAKGTLQNCILVEARYHCLAQNNKTSVPGGLPEQNQR